MSLEKIKFTVIIPTRERSDVLEWSLRSITTQTYKNLEIIVSDNFSNDGTEALVKNFNDSRIRYLNTAKRISMSENWEFALSHVTEGWVTIIGDDDALLPSSLEKVASLIEVTNTKAIRSATCEYQWPSLVDDDFGKLIVPFAYGWKKRNATEWLAKVMLGTANYTDLPVLYNGGFVDFSVLKSIKEKTGKFYKSCVPDVYSACAIASILKEYIYSFEPFAINGASLHSTGMDSFSKMEKSKKSPMMKFKSESNLPFHTDIPLNEDSSYPLSIQAIVYESYLQTQELRSESKFLNHEHQLELVLATRGQNKDSVEKWGAIFAKKHGLNFDKVILRSEHYKIHKFLNVLKKAILLLNSFIVNERAYPIKNVYEASIVACKVRTLKLSKLKSITFFMKLVISKISLRYISSEIRQSR